MPRTQVNPAAKAVRDQFRIFARNKVVRAAKAAGILTSNHQLKLHTTQKGRQVIVSLENMRTSGVALGFRFMMESRTVHVGPYDTDTSSLGPNPNTRIAIDGNLINNMAAKLASTYTA